MRDKLIVVLAILIAVIGWWGLYELTGQVTPEQPGVLAFFFALLFLAVMATLAPAAAYLNRRFAPGAAARDPWRFFRHSAWGGLCVTAWAWLQMHQALNVGLALITILIFVAIEVLLSRLRGESKREA
jgi:hypothetical protein